MTSPAPRSLNILVVDDEESSAISVAYVLRHASHAVDIAKDGPEAIRRLSENTRRYHIVTTDHAMLEVTGLDLVSRLRATGFSGKILVLSANVTPDLSITFLKLGADYIISKPFELAEMRKAVEHLGSGVEY